MAVAFCNAKTGKWVRLDECDEQDGALIEAKGPGFTKFLNNDYMAGKVEDRFIRQATAQVQAAGGRPVRWYFAEEETSRFAARLFAGNGLKNIQIFHVKALMP